jgi:hypothetical protein
MKRTFLIKFQQAGSNRFGASEPALGQKKIIFCSKYSCFIIDLIFNSCRYNLAGLHQIFILWLDFLEPIYKVKLKSGEHLTIQLVGCKSIDYQ